MAIDSKPRSPLRHWFRLDVFAYNFVSGRVVRCSERNGLRYNWSWKINCWSHLPFHNVISSLKIWTSSYTASMGSLSHYTQRTTTFFPEAENPDLELDLSATTLLEFSEAFYVLDDSSWERDPSIWLSITEHIPSFICAFHRLSCHHRRHSHRHLLPYCCLRINHLWSSPG